ncbi:NADPH:quinone reductase [Bryocella elongata]|uniref:NADPH:quinone reductase n=1 Tax=Bryocella elongata TaxID=863522 RepID=A0A1H6BJ07_9BACT|nr:zinc-binding alcohol dehydrogenase family protein [Bryocella elongata]SEG60592.1 NADPH:quinone reductase [Bryocella elongata]
MNAAVVTSYSQPPQYTTFDNPIPAEGEVLVQVRAAGLHQIVRSIAAGKHYMSTGKFPFIPGVDGVGIFPDGSRNYFGGARFPYGTMCEQTVITPAVVIPLPESIDDAMAAAIANPAMSSWFALDRAGFVAGQSVLILGATGTSGQLAVQIAKHRGAGKVIATGRNPEALAKLKSLGADEVVSLDQPTEALVASLRDAMLANGVDVVLDYLWGSPAEAALNALGAKGVVKPGGRVRFVQIGNLAGETIALPAHTLRSTNIELLGSGFGSGSMNGIAEAIGGFFQLAATQKFEFSYKAVPLAEVTERWGEKDGTTRLVFVP